MCLATAVIIAALARRFTCLGLLAPWNSPDWLVSGHFAVVLRLLVCYALIFVLLSVSMAWSIEVSFTSSIAFLCIFLYDLYTSRDGCGLP